MVSDAHISRRQVLKGASVAGAAGLVGAAGLAALAPGTAAAEANDDEDTLTGTWRGTATLNGFGSFGTLLSFAAGGTLVHSAAIDLQNTSTAANLSTPSYGAWRQRASNTFDATFEFFTFDNQTNPSGSGLVRERLTVDGDDLTGHIALTLFDTTGTVIPGANDVEGSLVATRIRAN
jgi:TAT (twin-arginine translocation) pathway signal sequence